MIGSPGGSLITTLGALDLGSPVSHVELKKSQCPLSLFFFQFPCRFQNVECRMTHVMSIIFFLVSIIFFLMSIGSMSRVDFKKQPSRPVEFKGQGPYPGGRGTGGGRGPHGVGISWFLLKGLFPYGEWGTGGGDNKLSQRVFPAATHPMSGAG